MGGGLTPAEALSWWLVADPLFARHNPDPHHPESPGRLAAARRGLLRALHDLPSLEIPSRPASDDEILAIHRPSHLARLRSAEKLGLPMLDADTPVGAGSFEVALNAAGASIDLALKVWQSGQPGIALVRPPGHHAEPDRAMGFCWLNNIALATAALRSQGVDRVAILDLDVHHGNGTQAAFWDDPAVFYASIHQAPFYPGSGSPQEVGVGRGKGATLNKPLPPGSGGDAWMLALGQILVALERFDPEIVLVSLGLDGHGADPLGGMCLNRQDYFAMGQRLAAWAQPRMGGRIATFLEGGYDMGGIEEGIEGWVTGVREGLEG
ncbi:MAG: histone deacetylase [Alphaproteobacteria bacterium CG_4_10_14_0_2_um_filter_63_37]|nr:MAG: histone deacetylase [Alphaproteobacteria bacterium CG_4_10_14_0_2_um_filter_63_37]